MDVTNTKKLSAAGIGIPFAAIVVWAVPAFGGPAVMPEIAAAFGALCTWIASALIPDTKEE